MKTISRFIVLLLASLSTVLPSVSFASSYGQQLVGQVQVDSRPCMFFWLSGVGQADPAVPGQAWFAIPKSASNYQEMISELLSAKMTGKRVFVQTDGSITCGFATATVMGLEQ